ncbi:MAG: hypothetical protein CMI09_07870 [Oceanospirillaceae bacterium]|nr:hypothetical protein [Oceanospirillaceae bacterium]
MLNEQETLRLLIFATSHNDAESIVSLLRNSGDATRAHFVESLEDFEQQIQQQTWDLVLSEQEVKNVSFRDLMQQVRRLNKDLPIILVGDEVDPMVMENALKRGACTIIPRDESNLLVLAIHREMRHLRNRREARALEVRLRDAEKRCQSLLESSRDAVAYIHDGMHIFANSAYLKLFGYESTEELEGMPIMDMVDPGSQGDFKHFLKRYIARKEQSDELNTIGLNGEGKLFPMKMAFSPATYSEERCTQVTIRSNEKNTALEAKLREMSNIDVMTNLFNKPFFMSQLEKSVDSAVLSGVNGAILYVNIDSFGKVKNEVGISLADKVLVELANVVRGSIPEDASPSRISEDIFACILMGVDANEALETAQSLCKAIEDTLIDIGDRTITVTSSIGVSLINESSARPEDVLQNAHCAADAVRNQEGHQHGNGASLFVPEEPAEVEPEDLSLEDRLNEALQNDGLRLLFQPLISLRGEEAGHYEALLRLKMSDGNELSAGEFLNQPIIKDELKRKIDRWVILNSVKRLAAHVKSGEKTRIFINLSAPSLSDDSLPGWIAVALRASKLPAGSIIMQFNEDDATRMLKQAQQFTAQLQDKAVPVSISRFGCALAPFKNLKHIPASYVKIDGSYTRDMSTNPETQDQLKKILGQLHEEDKQTIVPQVESAASLATLWQLGVHFIQGYYVQAPQDGLTYKFEEESSF